MYQINEKEFNYLKGVIGNQIESYKANYLHSEDEMWSLGIFAIGKACDKYKEDSNASFTTYATSAIVNEFRNMHRTEKRTLRNVYLDNKVNDDFRDSDCYYEIIKEREYDIALKVTVEQAIAKLRPYEQDIVHWMMEGYEYRVIAEMQGVTKQCMHSRILRIRRKLAEDLKELKGAY